MKSEQIQTAAIVVAAMVLGGVLTFFLLRQNQPAPPVTVPKPPAEAVSRITPPPGKLEAQVLRQNEALDDGMFDAAMARARAARQAGTLKPLATTPEEFARVLGALNFRIHDYTVRYATPPPDGSPQEAAAQKEMDQLLAELANLLSDDALLAKLDESTPAELARSQACLAAGALDLDAATTAKVQDIITKTYAEALPPDLAGKTLTPEQDAAFDQKLEALNEKMVSQILELLTPDQRARFDALGADQVLFGLRGTDDDEPPEK
jgi:hypothetical protein